MHIVLVDDVNRNQFSPFSVNKALADLRFGIFTFKERWEQCYQAKVSVSTIDYLQELYEVQSSTDEIIWVNATVLPSKAVEKIISALAPGEVIKDNSGWLLAKPAASDHNIIDAQEIQLKLADYVGVALHSEVEKIQSALQLLQTNDSRIQKDVELIKQSNYSHPVPECTRVSGAANVFVAEGATIHSAIINATNGPVYIGKNALIMEGCLLRGPISIGEGAVLKMGAKLYGGTTIGNYAVAGGEIKHSILMDYSNKAHDGYLGDSIIGSWCNIGAGTSNSNVKNTAGAVKIWDDALQTFVPGGNKCGVMMGDYSKVAINSSINTGSWIGCCANVFGTGLLPKKIPHFSWGASGDEYYKIDNALAHIENWRQMKHKPFTEAEKNILRYIFEHSKH